MKRDHVIQKGIAYKNNWPHDRPAFDSLITQKSANIESLIAQAVGDAVNPENAKAA
jgi:hypothetical protein